MNYFTYTPCTVCEHLFCYVYNGSVKAGCYGDLLNTFVVLCVYMCVHLFVKLTGE